MMLRAGNPILFIGHFPRPKANESIFIRNRLMKLFIDSAEVDKIKEAWSWGIIDGVTTNPSHVAKTGRKHLDVYREICDIVDGPISLETLTLTAGEMVEE